MGYVYLICDPGNDRFKIGVTRDLKSNRIKKLQTGNSSELFIHTIYETEWPFRLESMLHKHFGTKRVLNEWFNLNMEDLSGFVDTCNLLNDNIRVLSENPFFAKDLK